MQRAGGEVYVSGVSHTMPMRSALLVLLAFTPLSASAQGLLTPSDNLFIGFPFFAVSHDLTYEKNGAVTTSSGTSTPFYVAGGYLVDFDDVGSGMLSAPRFIGHHGAHLRRRHEQPRLHLGLQATYAFDTPVLNVTGLTTVSYAWGFESSSQALSGRALKVMTDVS